jgi:hypothetical protein
MSWLDEEISTDGVNPDQLERGTCRTAGKYHAELLDVKPDPNEKSGGTDLRFDFQILAGTVPHEVGNIFYHRERDPQGNEQRVFFLTKLALQLGVIRKDDVGPGKALNPKKLFEARGRQYVIEVVATPDKTNPQKTYANLGKVWAVDDDAVSDVPKDKDALEAAGAPTAQSVVKAAVAAPAALDDI